ncbi:MAG: ribonuclease Z [Thermoleophilia bacterium]|jgi:ribonuclease Z|nr:ribonuclease Z [Thermoleophilia bacterium]
MDLTVTFLGTAASVPSAARGTSATLIARRGARWLVDCGEGTQRQLLRSGLGLVDLDAVLLTHLHLDHVLGLPGLIKTFQLRDREKPMLVAGPPGLAALLDELRVLMGRPPRWLVVEEQGPGVVLRDEGAEVVAFHTDHGPPSLGYALVEDDRPGEFDVAAARALGVPHGPLYGVLQRGGEVALDDGRVVRSSEVVGTPRPGRSVVISGDTRPCESTRAAAEGASLLVHEATFTAEEQERAVQTRHSTAAEAAGIARDAGVGLLAITHISSRVLPREARREAEAHFARVVVPRDFDQIEIPFPERGEPRHVPAGARPGAPAEAPPASGGAATVSESDL